MGILWLIIVGLIAGAIARFIVPGKDPMGWIGTIVLGIVGSFIGGSLYQLIFEGDLDITRASTIIGSIIGAVIALLVWRVIRARTAA